VILSLRGQFRCIAPDYPGFGLSREAPGYDFRPRSHSMVIEAFVDALGLAEVTVFGYARGGPIGLGFAGRRPELVTEAALRWTAAGQPAPRFARW
jgi:haloalkane dehalogenase